MELVWRYDVAFNFIQQRFIEKVFISMKLTGHSLEMRARVNPVRATAP
jgi:hypothetical protein